MFINLFTSIAIFNGAAAYITKRDSSVEVLDFGGHFLRQLLDDVAVAVQDACLQNGAVAKGSFALEGCVGNAVLVALGSPFLARLVQFNRLGERRADESTAPRRTTATIYFDNLSVGHIRFLALHDGMLLPPGRGDLLIEERGCGLEVTGILNAIRAPGDLGLVQRLDVGGRLVDNLLDGVFRHGRCIVVAVEERHVQV